MEPQRFTVGVASYKGGVCKTTTSWHLAGFLSERGRTVLFDGDANESATEWAAEANGNLPFDVEPIEAAITVAADYQYRVIDTGQAPEEADFYKLARNCDVLIVPTLLDPVDAKGLGKTIKVLRKLTRRDGTPIPFWVLISRVEPHQKAEVADLREELGFADVRIFNAEIPKTKAFSKAQAKGVLVRDANYPRADAAWAAFQEVGKELLP